MRERKAYIIHHDSRLLVLSQQIIKTILCPCFIYLCSPKNFGGAYSRRLVRPSFRPSVLPSVRPSVRTYHSCLAHNFVIWNQISKQFHRNDHNIETTCRVQHLGCYLEGQGHSMTFQQNRVRPITLLFEVRFYNYFT